MIRIRFLMMLVLSTLAFSVLGDEKQEQSKLQAIKDKISALSQKLLQRDSEADKLSAELQKQELALAATNKKIAQLDNEMSALQEGLAGLLEKKISLEELNKAQQAQIAREINSAYRQGSSEPVKLLLNQEDPQKAARIIKYYSYFTDARRKKMEQFTETLNQLEDVEKSISEKQQILLSGREALVAETEDLKREQSERTAILASINEAMNSDKAQLEKLARERKAVEQVIASLEQAIHGLGDDSALPFAKLRGKLPWPVKGKVSQGFGSFRAQSLKWTGWLITAPEGAAITSVHNGRVVFADYLRGQGLMMIIDHGGGYLTLYAHNQVLLKETGEWVQGGEKVALTGNSGGLASSALYFEIRHNGRPQDPKSWLAAR